MSNKTLQLSEKVYKYLLDHSLREPAILRELREKTAADSMSAMQIAPEQGQFMSLLVKLLGVKNMIEIGVYTGYSSLCCAMALPPGGKLLACDINKAWTDIAREYWQRAGVSDRIQLRLGPATETLDKLLESGESGRYDFAFIDADKENYRNYYEKTLLLLRPGGVMAIDNVLWDGKVADETVSDIETLAIRELNALVHADNRVDMSMLPLADGLTLVRKK